MILLQNIQILCKIRMCTVNVHDIAFANSQIGRQLKSDSEAMTKLKN